MQSSGPRNSRRWLVSLIVLLVIIGLCWWLWPASSATHKGAPVAQHRGGGAGGGAKGPIARPGFGGATGPIPVRVAPVTLGDFPIYYKALGTVTALNTINVRTQVAGAGQTQLPGRPDGQGR